LARRTKLSALRGPNIDEIVSGVRMRVEDKETTRDRWKRRTDEGLHGWQYIQEIVLPVAKATARARASGRLEVPREEELTWPQYELLEELGGGQAEAQALPYHVVYRVLASEGRPLRALMDELKDDPRNPVRTRQIMYELYKEHGFSASSLARALGRSTPAVVEWLRALDIPVATLKMRVNVFALGPQGLMDHRVDSEGRHIFVYYLKESEPLAYVAGFALGDGSPSSKMTRLYNADRELLEGVYEEAEELAEELSAKPTLSARVGPIREARIREALMYYFDLHVDGPATMAGDPFGNALLEADYREAFVRGLLRGPYKGAFLAGLWDADGLIDRLRRRAIVEQASHNWWLLELIEGELEAQGLGPHLHGPYVRRAVNAGTGREYVSLAKSLELYGDNARELCELMLPHLKRGLLMERAEEVLKAPSGGPSPKVGALLTATFEELAHARLKRHER
jgi:hypothetical protein